MRSCSAGDYGYGWWIQEVGDQTAGCAWGLGGQYIFFFRDLDLIIAVTSSTTASDERWGYRRQLFNLPATQVLQASD